MTSKILALIPARSGSKRVPGKNSRSLGGIPLVEHTIKTAVQSGSFDSVVLSTDADQLLALAESYPAVTGIRRNPQTAGDKSTVVDVLEEVLEHITGLGLEQPDAIMVLQPTSPFRSVESIQKAVALHEASDGCSVVSVSHPASHPYWCKTVAENGELHDFLSDFDEYTQSQGLPEVYALNGLIYLTSVANFRTRHSLYSEHTRALPIESAIEAFDIDTEDEWFIAEAVYEHQRATSK